MPEWGIFNDESVDYTEDQAVQAGFWSKKEAELAMKEDYTEFDDDLTVHEIEEPEEEDDEDEEDDSYLDEDDEQ